MKAIFVLLFSMSVFSVTATVKFSSGTITPDGNFTEAAWATADSLTNFVSPDGWGNTSPVQSAVIKLLWDDNAFYIGASISDSHIVKTATSLADIDADDMLEFHIAPDVHNSQNFVLPADYDTSNAQFFHVFEFNLTPFTRPNFYKAKPVGKNAWYTSWNTTGVTTAILIDSAQNHYWVEIRIPYTVLDTGKLDSQNSIPTNWQPAIPPHNGSQWKFNATHCDNDGINAVCYSTWSFNGNYAYGSDVHFHDHNNFGLLTFSGKPTAIETGNTESEECFQVSPNPFNPSAHIQVNVPIDSKEWSLNVYNSQGIMVANLSSTLILNNKLTGNVEWTAAGLPSGLYVVKLTTGKKQFTRRLTLLK